MRNIKIQIYILFIVIFLPVIGVNAQSSWFWLQPLPTGATLNSVDFWDRNTGYTCGKAGTVTKTTNGGMNWVLLGQITVYELRDIECIDVNTCIVVGYNGFISKTTNGGMNWIQINSGVTAILMEINFLSTLTGYISGSNGTLLKTINGGLNWTQLNVGVTSTLFDVSFINPLRGSLAGINNLYTTTNGGLNWTIHQLGTFFDYFPSVQYINDSTIYGSLTSISPDRIVISQNGGLSWINYTIESLNVDEIIRSMKFKNETTGFLVTNYGNIHKTTNSGVNWFIDTSFTPENIDADVFYDINSIDTNNFYAAGSGGFIVRTTNSGKLWERQTGVHQTYNDVYFTDENTGYVVGEKGILKKTTDAGISWNRIDLNTSFDINKIVFTNSNTGFICGDSGLVKKTTNAGLNWIDQLTPAGDTNILTIYFINNSLGFLSNDNGTIYKTVSGGLNWFKVFILTGTGSPLIYDFDFLNTQRGVAAASNRILLTSDSGESWNIVISNGSSLISSEYLDSLNMVVGGLGSRLLKSTDNGFSWFNLIISHTVYSIQFKDNQYGIICGDNGYISKTTNGGINWILQPRVATENLNSIYFLNSNTGYTVGITGQILKTTNGGLSFIKGNETINPDDFMLFQNYPNPFNPKTVIKYFLKKNVHVKLIIHDITGREVVTIVNERQNQGIHETEFNSSGLPSGIYFYTLFNDNFKIDTKKGILIK